MDRPLSRPLDLMVVRVVLASMALHLPLSCLEGLGIEKLDTYRCPFD